MSEPIRVGIAGLGRSGWDIHARALAERDDFRVVAVADGLPERRDEARARFGCRAYADVDELASDPEPELVVVAVPSHLHAPTAAAMLRAGKHALVEKPFALSVSEAESLFAAAEAAGRVVTAFQNRRFDPDFLRVQQLIRSGVLGEIHFLRLARYGFARRRDWQTLRRMGGGMLNNWGPHLIDQALVLLGGTWTGLFAQLRRVASGGDVEDHVKLAFRNERGVTAEVELAVSAYTQPEWLVLGARGSLQGTTRALEWRHFDPAAVPPLEVSDAPPAGRAYGTPESLPWVTERAEPRSERSPAAQYYDHLRAVLRDGETPLVTPEHLRAQVSLIEAARRQCPDP